MDEFDPVLPACYPLLPLFFPCGQCCRGREDREDEKTVSQASRQEINTTSGVRNRKRLTMGKKALN